ncbi:MULTISPECIES: GNAT family N-acetyltransferase [unclassified Acidovorax]|jgi:predicted N-acyltransferase|uniref:GNAT family N-acetyltransferase n=1 Tax=unclassified Acidovorax TaxID=2684926 RepID=UPI000BD1BE94|nr:MULTISPECIES: GNAT family N-acetyltransferase [unclassified Acidovorax]OYZ69684.1 MAG: GNAT family N-acetyltransferase [Acidovorax sp. 24-64-9]HQS64179.1 GNAT family N-acetyltransferase [Acidovorax defluvii]
MAEGAIIARVLASPLEVDATAWNALLALQSHPTPFMRHEYLAALHESESAVPHTGWTPRFMTLWEGDLLVAACPLYLKSHSYGEYVFDWAWASAYEQHGVPYYPKAVVAVPFTPVPGTRLMARDAAARQGLVQALCQWCEDEGISSLHVLFASDDDVLTGAREGLMLRHTVQFHWKNVAPTLGTDVSSLPPEGALAALGRPGGGSGAAPTLGTGGFLLPTESVLAAVESHCDSGSAAAGTLAYRDFDDFLAHLTQEKRKKFRQERRRVAEAGVTFRWAQGADITADDWNFFYRCYERTYLEHGNPPYLTRAFFQQMADRMPEHWLLFIAEREGRPIASSLIAISAQPSSARGQYHSKYAGCTAYGRYWGALERVDCLHFEACYYQPLAWCIAHGVQRFEGGAQGEHKMARALLPVPATSMHWLAHPAFADAVDRFLAREGAGVEQYLDHLQARSPFRAA